MLYKLLHNIEDGGGARAFECCTRYWCNGYWMYDMRHEHTCGKITRTKRGMLMHLLRVHGIHEQGELWQKDTTNAQKTTVSDKSGTPKPNSTASGTTLHAANGRSHGQ